MIAIAIFAFSPFRETRFHDHHESPFFNRHSSSNPHNSIHHILNLVWDYEDPVVCYHSNDKDYSVTQWLILRSVCRRFRDITLHLDFWYEDDFQFTELMASYYEHGRGRPEEELLEFLDVLFLDKSLVNALGRRKTEWMFNSLDILGLIMQRIPLFKRNARVIHLGSIEEEEEDSDSSSYTSLDRAFEWLRECSHVTTLIIQSEYRVDLTGIAVSFPFLKTLICSPTDHFHGSLDLGPPGQHIHRLRKLLLDLEGPHVGKFRHWLPLESAETLTELSLNCGPNVHISFFDIPSLDLFRNLKSLSIRPLSSPLSDFLVRSQARLETFNTTLSRLVPIDVVRAMFQAPCLKTVKQFGLSNLHERYMSSHNDYWEAAPSTAEMRAAELGAIEQFWSLVLDEFTSMLHCVEQLKLELPLHIECCAYFSRMRNLKLLDWDLGLLSHMDLGVAMFDGNHREKVYRALETAFAAFVEKPRLKVR